MGDNGEEKGVYYPVDKATDWPLQFAIRLGGAALQFILDSPLAAEVASLLRAVTAHWLGVGEPQKWQACIGSG